MYNINERAFQAIQKKGAARLKKGWQRKKLIIIININIFYINIIYFSIDNNMK